jgi:TolB protein
MVLCATRYSLRKAPAKASKRFESKLISTGTRRTTCALFYPDGKSVLYAFTHLAGKECPPIPDRSKYCNKYIWPFTKAWIFFRRIQMVKL